ncbi:hypothetical protein B5K05_13525 [Rhizobium phaseoli]|uniref:hypothetical protein n=1 Tax=Rhizobium phaseoli TaxID=396 RepID=UPI000E0D7F20|nr:hypothetical protein [Rhizobium phaseoli]RDJ10144.1 hypothetical protein B5K04_13500 [Rhizobium phaseoli]RDJ14144.1 hypothetical protein B5K05_13525 [Rhizobium phaseoli]
MSTASDVSSQVPPTAFTKAEIELQRDFARKCIRAKRFEDLSSRYMAMKAECHRRGLRACDFQTFRNAIRLTRLGTARRLNVLKSCLPAQEYYFGLPTETALVHEHDSFLNLWRRR